MDCPDGEVSLFKAVDQLEHTSGVTVGDDAGACFEDVIDFSLQEFIGHHRLDDIVDTGAAAAPVAFGQLNQFQVRNGVEDGAWLAGDLLAVGQVAAFMVGHFCFGCFGVGWRRFVSDFFQPLMNIFDLGIPELRFGGPVWVILEESMVMLHMGAAAASIADNGIELIGRELLELFDGQQAGEFGFAVMGMERAAAVLAFGAIDLAAVPGEHLHAIAVDLAEDQVLGTAGQESDTVAGLLFPFGGSGDSNHPRRKLFGNLRRHRFKLLEPFGHQHHDAAFAQQPLDTQPLIEAHEPTKEEEPAQVHEKPMDGGFADGIADGVIQQTRFFSFGAGMFKNGGVIDAGRTGAHAGQAAEAEIDLLGEGTAHRHFSIGNGAGQRDASARAMPFAAGFRKGGAD